MNESAFAPKLLIFAKDEAVGREIRDAVRNGASEGPVNVYITTDLTQAVNTVRDREPNAVMIELSGELSHDRSRIGELRSVNPELTLVGVYSGESNTASISSGYMVELVRLGVSDFLRRPIAEGELNGFMTRLIPNQNVNEPSRYGTCVAFISNKGGVGKSSLAVNTATALAMRYPDEVLLIDASLQMGVCAPMLNLSPETSLYDAFEQRQRLDSTLIRQLATPHESGLLLLAAPPDPLAAADIDDQSIVRVLNLARRTFRFVVVDTFPLFDQVVMSVLDIATRAYVVLDNVVPTVLSVVHLLRLLENLQYPSTRLRIVVNRYQQLAGNPLIDDIARSLRMNVDHVLPYDKRMITAANVGRPCTMDWVRWSKLHRELKQLASEIAALQPVQEEDD
ncbi:AAA family ATPase [Neorhodopirellula pilleata]|uniref:Septum site-determining protein MinD n=1 Tax=Neorhodopirellula pilleata TaxID=2714738 RepID=A0A5C6A116_9BACT|nr:AAA family ATPase [Neorhodopirellula pilleata]TWT93524.1 Septum site-determining protein MinD [Neorhodopirellula pilleata]